MLPPPVEMILVSSSSMLTMPPPPLMLELETPPVPLMVILPVLVLMVERGAAVAGGDAFIAAVAIAAAADTGQAMLPLPIADRGFPPLAKLMPKLSPPVALLALAAHHDIAVLGGDVARR